MASQVAGPPISVIQRSISHFALEVMSFDGNDKQWKCGKGGSVNLHKVSSIVRDIGEQPCLHHSPLKVVKVVIAVSNMLKPDKWQASFDSDGKILGFHRVLKSIILGGIDPSIRAEVWEFLLGCYALSSTTEYRTQLRTARRERYRDLLNQCQMMHSSIGTGSLAYPVGSKVMDMRLSSKDEGSRDTESQQGRISEATVNKIDDGCASDVDKSYRNREQNFSNACEGSRDTESQRGRISEATVNKIDDGCASDVDKLYRNREQNFSNASDLLSVRGSTDTLDCSDILPSPDQRNCSSSNSHRTNELNFVADSYLDFPALPVTDLFTDDGKDKRAIRVHENKCSTRRKLRYEEQHMHSFQINNNADLVVELGSHRSNENILRASSISEVAHPDVDPSPSRSKSHECEKEMINRFRISDAPEMPAACAGASQGAGSGDRVSEWLWTLHRIVVDVVRTDSHLDFYEDTKNLARMSDILAVYAWVDPETGYCQGMSDLLSPFVVLFEDNADAFWCFEMLIRRMRENFKMEGPTGVMKQLQALWHILELTDKEVFSHLSHIGAESLHFAFRMLLILFRRELSFNEALCMWEMIWAADFDLSLNCLLEENCPEVLAIQLPPETVAESGEESIHSIGSGPKGGLPSKHGPVERSVSDSNGVRSAQARPFCGLTKTFWSKNDRCQVPTIVSSTRNGDDELPVFCVAAILVMNRQKILKVTRSIDDLIKIFNDNMLEIRVKRCIRTAIKLRKKYFYKLIKNRSPAAHDGT